MEITREVIIKSGDGILITPVKKERYNMPSYNCIGVSFQEVIISGLSKPAREMLNILMAERNIDTNVALFIVKGVNAKCKLTKAYNELKKFDLVKRTRKQHYMINPKAIFPKFDRYHEVVGKWSNI